MEMNPELNHRRRGACNKNYEPLDLASLPQEYS